MLRVIQEAKPTWIIGENVTGIINMGLETTVLDLEAEGYEVELLVLPACGVGALHKRDRVWIVANLISVGWDEGVCKRIQSSEQKPEGQKPEYICKGVSRTENVAYKQGNRWDSQAQQEMDGEKDKRKEGCGLDNRSKIQDVPDTFSQRGCGRHTKGKNAENVGELRGSKEYGNWSAQPDMGKCSDGLSEGLVRVMSAWADGTWEEGIPRVATGIKERANKLKALGNSIVPQVVIPIMQAIKEIDDKCKDKD